MPQRFGISDVVLAAVVLAVVCACTPGRAVDPPRPHPQERFGAPMIIAPRDLRGRAGDPCRRLLSPPQLDGLGMSGASSRPVPLPGAVECLWQNDDRQALGLAGWDRRDLLVDTYRTKLLPVFVPTTILGLPAVLQKSAPDAVSCTLTTGVADGQALETSWYSTSDQSGRLTTDPCERAKAAAEAVVSTLPPLS